jgi:hypothetical protein
VHLRGRLARRHRCGAGLHVQTAFDGFSADQQGSMSVVIHEFFTDFFGS